MAYAKSSLIQDIRHIVNDEPWETTSTTTTTSSTVAVPDGTKWAVGDVGEWSFTGTVGGEQFLVQSISSNNLTVLRGYNGTTAETHGSGDRVVKNPRYSVIQITDSIDRVIEGAYPSVWTTLATTVTPDTTTIWFDSGTSTQNVDTMDLVSATQLYGGSSEYIGVYGVTTPYMPSRPIHVVRNMDTALVTSGIGVRFPGGFHHATNNVKLTWRKRLTSTVATGNYSDLTEGLLTEAIANGVAGRLVGNKEFANVSEDAQMGRANIGSFLSTASWFELKSRELLSQHRMYLMRTAPPMTDQTYLPGYWA